MIALIKANMQRMIKHIFYIPALILAVAITFLAVYLRGVDLDRIMVWHRIVSLGIPAFFSVFIPLFLGVEYQSGTFRNKVISGHKQSEVYIADLISILIGVFIMEICWFMTGVVKILVSGFSINGEFLISSAALMLIFFAYASLITLFSLRIRNMIASTFFGIFAFMGSYFLGVTAFSVNMITGLKLAAVIENILPIGQWFGVMNADESLPMPVRLIFSLAFLIIITVIGTYRINKRQLN